MKNPIYNLLSAALFLVLLASCQDAMMPSYNESQYTLKEFPSEVDKVLLSGKIMDKESGEPLKAKLNFECYSFNVAEKYEIATRAFEKPLQLIVSADGYFPVLTEPRVYEKGDNIVYDFYLAKNPYEAKNCK